IYDNNHITIEGNTRITFTEDIAARFLGYGWNVLRVGDANDIDRIEHALDVFHKTKDRPTFIILDSHIGYGSPHKQDTAAAHGEPLGEEEVRLTKRDYGWPEDAKFLVPDAVRAHFAAGIGARGAPARRRWTELCAAYRSKYPQLATEIDLMQRRELPPGWDRGLPVFPPDPKGIAGRDASGKVLNVLAQNIPWLLGGSADLGTSNKTLLTFEGAGDFEPDNRAGKNLHFGIREHARAAAVNGLALSKLPASCPRFFIFSDYARPAIRLSALMELPTIFVFTHDAMGDGEDGPTHQPVEQLASFRAEPGLVVLRPADANEVVEAYRYIMQLKHKPAMLALSRQPLPTLDRSKYASASGLARGAYVLADPPNGKPDVILIASGSEVSLCVEAHEKLATEGIRARVVSMPSWDIFEDQSAAYRDSVLPPEITARVAVEQASTFGWERYVGQSGRIIGMKTFGASAPLKELLRKYRFEPERVTDVVKELLSKRKNASRSFVHGRRSRNCQSRRSALENRRNTVSKRADIVFLFDVDNTLLDNDRVQGHLSEHLEQTYGRATRDRYWQIFEDLRRELGYADYLGALERYRIEDLHRPEVLRMSSWLVDYPFVDRLYTRALEAVKHVQQWGTAVILSDGDAVFQPRKVERSGLWDAFENRVLIYIHKEEELDD